MIIYTLFDSRNQECIVIIGITSREERPLSWHDITTAESFCVDE